MGESIARPLVGEVSYDWHKVESAEMFEGSDRFFAFTSGGVWMYDNHRNATVYMQRDQALAFAHQIIRRYA